jgi:putative membrane protein
MMGNGFGFGLGIPGLGMIVFWGLIILLVVWLVRLFSAGKTGTEKSARQILDERFARGEIDREEYEQRKRALD